LLAELDQQPAGQPLKHGAAAGLAAGQLGNGGAKLGGQGDATPRR
jgi:hypothetical protein